MKKVLFIGMSHNPGGVEKFMLNVFRNLEGNGFHFDFINDSTLNISNSNEIINKGGDIINVPINKSWIGHLYRYKVAYNFFVKHHNYDIVHLNAVSINVLFWLKAAESFGIKHLIIHSHSAGVKYDSKLKDVFAKLLSIHNRHYLNDHPNIHELAASNKSGIWMFGRNNEFNVIDNGIDTKPLQHSSKKRLFIKKSLNINHNDKVIITTSRLEIQKNYPKIINVFNCIHNQNYHIKLVIIGNGSEMSRIQDMISKYKLKDYVYLLGMKNKKEISELLNIGDVMLMPSFYEGLPFSLVEAQSAGIPALVSSESIPKEANITNEVYYLSLNQSDEKWAKYILSILKHPYNVNKKLLMNKMVTNSKYNINYSINQMSQYYNKLIILSNCKY